MLRGIGKSKRECSVFFTFSFMFLGLVLFKNSLELCQVDFTITVGIDIVEGSFSLLPHSIGNSEAVCVSECLEGFSSLVLGDCSSVSELGLNPVLNLFPLLLGKLWPVILGFALELTLNFVSDLNEVPLLQLNVSFLWWWTMLLKNSH